MILTFIGGAFRAVDVLGDPDLEPESATTYNAGVLVDSGGFQASVDYWRYDFEGPIESEPVSGMVSAMFGASGTANCGNPAYAGLQARFTFSGGVCAVSNVQRAGDLRVQRGRRLDQRVRRPGELRFRRSAAAQACRRASPAAT